VHSDRSLIPHSNSSGSASHHTDLLGGVLTRTYRAIRMIEYVPQELLERYHSREAQRIGGRRHLQAVARLILPLRLRYNQRLIMSTTELHEKVTLAADAGNVRSEFSALISGCGIYELGQHAKIELTGRDRVRWLNGMVSNNIRDLAVGQGVYAFLLNAQGHILGDLYAYNRGVHPVIQKLCGKRSPMPEPHWLAKQQSNCSALRPEFRATDRTSASAICRRKPSSRAL